MNIIEKILSIPKILYINFIIFDLKTAFKLPILVKYNTKLIGIRKGCINLNTTAKRGIIRIGISQGTIIERNQSPCILRFGDSGVWNVGNKVWCAGYSVINVNGTLTIGDNFTSNSTLKISCKKSIIIGNDVLVGWNVTIIDSDGHDIIRNEKVLNSPRDITIGSHVWICANCSILKGANIPSKSVLAYGSTYNKRIFDENIIILNNKILKENICWEA